MAMAQYTETLDEGRLTFAEPTTPIKDRPCLDVMKRDVAWVSDDESITVAAQKMKAAQVGFLPVCDHDRKVKGTLTDRDLAIRAVAENRIPDATPVAAVMTHDVIACSPTDPIERAEALMAEHRVSRIVIVGPANTLHGVISLSDIAELDTEGRAASTMREVTARETSPSR
jgi:CBS domain-containing protein